MPQYKSALMFHMNKHKYTSIFSSLRFNIQLKIINLSPISHRVKSFDEFKDLTTRWAKMPYSTNNAIIHLSNALDTSKQYTEYV